MTFKQRSLTHRFGVSFRACLEKLAAPAECAKVEQKLVWRTVEFPGLGIAVFSNFDLWLFMAKKLSLTANYMLTQIVFWNFADVAQPVEQRFRNSSLTSCVRLRSIAQHC